MTTAEKAKHTPGPWTVSQYLDDGRWGVVTSNSEIIVSVRSAEGQLREEDARLIAAAPEMLEALEAIAAQGGNLSDDNIERVSGINDGKSRAIMYLNSRQIAQAAIRKARGEQ